MTPDRTADAPSASPPTGRRPRWRRWLRRGLLGGLLLVLAVAAGHPLWLPPALERLAPWASDRILPFRIELASVERARVGRLTVRGFRLEALEEGEALRVLAADSLDLRFSLRALLAGDLLGAAEELTARDLELELDLSLPPAEARPEDPPGEPLALPDALPRLSLENLALRLKLSEEQRVDARVASLTTEGGERLALDARDAVFTDPGAPLDYERLRLEARYAEQVFTDLSLELDGEALLEGSSVDLSEVQGGTVALLLEARLGGGTARIDARFAPGSMRFGLDAQGVQLAPLFARLPMTPPPLEARVDLRGELELPASGLLDGRGALALSAHGCCVDALAVGHVELELKLADRVLTVPRLSVTDEGNELRISDVVADLAGVELDQPDVRALLERTRGRVSARVEQPARLVESTSDPLLRVLSRTRADLEARLEEGLLELERGSVESPVGRLVLEQGFVQLDTDGAPEMDVDWRFDLEELERAARLFGLEGFGGRLAGSVEASGAWPELSGACALNGKDLTAFGRLLGDVALVGRSDASRIELSTLRAQSQAQTLEASGKWDRAVGALEDVELRLDARDLAALFPEVLQGGSARIALTASGPLESPRTGLELTATAAQAAGLPPLDLRLSATGEGRTLSVRELSISGEDVALAAGGTLELDESYAPRAVGLDALAISSRGASLLKLEEPARVELGADLVRVDSLVLTGPLGEVRAETTRTSEGTRARLELVQLTPTPHLAAFLPEGLALESVDARAEAFLNGDALELTSSGAARGLRAPGLGPPVELAWELGLADRRLELRALQARAGDALTLDVLGQLPLDLVGPELLPDGPLSLRVLLTSEEPAALFSEASTLPRPRGALTATLELGGEVSRAEGSLRVTGEGLGLGLGGGESFDLGRLDAQLLCGPSLALEHFVLHGSSDAPGVELRASGAVQRPLDLRALVEDAGAWAAEAPALVGVELDLPELARLRPLLRRLGLEGLPVRDGRLDAKVELAGPLGGLERGGRLELRDGVFRFGSELPTASLVDADVELSGSALRITRGTGELGGAPFEFGGQVDLGAAPVLLDVTLSGEDLLLYRARGIKVRADADLEVAGPLDQLRVSGKIALADSRYARNFEVDLTRRSGPSSGVRGLTFFRLTEPPLSTMRFDVDIATREAFHIGTTTVSGKVRPDLRLIGTGEVPVVTGAIYIDPTTISLPGSTLRIESGTIQFREEDPFMPRLALNGGTRLRGYDITVVVTGTLAEPEIILSSNPPLPDDELLLLVTTGQVPTEGEAASASDTARILALYLAKDFLARWLSTESTDSEESLLSRFEVVAGEDVSRSGADTIWVSFRVTENVVSTRDKLYLTAERDIFDKFNYGVRLVFRFR